MIKNRTTITALLMGIFLLGACNPSNEKNNSIPIIDIEKGLKQFKIRKLSTFARKLRYVRLETNPNCLVTQNIKKIYIEKGKIIIMDQAPFLKVFDAYTGKYLYNIGRKGQGPGELPYLYSSDVNPPNNVVLLNWNKISNQFNLEGKFIKQIIHPQLNNKESIYSNSITINKNQYAAGIRYAGENQKTMIAVFNHKKQLITTCKSYENVIQHKIYKGVFMPFGQAGVFYRSPNHIRYFRGISDTIYSYHTAQRTFLPAFCFNYGKHKTTRKTWGDGENKDVIKISHICENRRYLFLDFYTKNASPEPFDDEIYRNGSICTFKNTAILGVFDKKSGSLDFLLQPIKGIRGLKNDLDEGIPFTVRSVSSKGELIDYHQSYKFLEYAEKFKNTSKSFKKLVEKIGEDDNPIVVIAE